MTERKGALLPGAQGHRHLSSVFRLWRWLTEPAVEVTDYETRLKSRWLARVFVVFVPIGLLLTAVPTLTNGQLPWDNPRVLIIAGLFIFLSVSYVLSHHGRYILASVIILVAANLTVYGIILLYEYDNPTNLTRDATYMIAMLLFGSIMLPLRYLTVHMVVTVIGLLILPRIVPSLTIVDLVNGPLSILVMTFVLLSFGIKVRDALEKHHVTALQEENAERRRAEEKVRASLEEKEVLLKEIHHRVKNNLQIVSSLLNLQSAKFSDPLLLAQFEDSQNRVRSMALVHERLYRSDDLAHIDFGGYLRQLTGSLVQNYQQQFRGITVEVEADAIRLDIDTAIPCGLLVNELVSNALKHAFPNGNTGTIRVALHRDALGQVQLVVRDDGVGFPAGVDFRHTSSLGLQLVNSLTKQLGGTVKLSQEAGTHFEICFTASSQKEKADPYD